VFTKNAKLLYLRMPRTTQNLNHEANGKDIQGMPGEIHHIIM
jgi:hypothetical protein